MKVTSFIEIANPWSYIAAVRLERAMGIFTITTGVVPEVKYRAFYPQRRPDVGLPLANADFDMDVESLVVAARKSGIEINIEDGVIADSLAALRLMLWVEMQYGQEVQKLLIDELWRAAFLEGADISDAFVLATRAGMVGLDIEITESFLSSSDFTDEVNLQTAAAVAVGFDKPPLAVVNEKWAIAGLQTQDFYFQSLIDIYQGESDQN